MPHFISQYSVTIENYISIFTSSLLDSLWLSCTCTAYELVSTERRNVQNSFTDLHFPEGFCIINLDCLRSPGLLDFSYQSEEVRINSVKILCLKLQSLLLLGISSSAQKRMCGLQGRVAYDIRFSSVSSPSPRTLTLSALVHLLVHQCL